MNNFDIIWKFAVIGCLISCLVMLHRIETAVNNSNTTIKEYFAPIQDVELPAWSE